MLTIDFCIPFVGSGVHYAEFLIDNLYATAAHPERISICMSAHRDADVQAIRGSSFAARVRNIVMAAPYPSHMPFFPSANHARAINSLAAASQADITVFSDYDMAFVSRGWDVTIETILQDRALCGVAYPPHWLDGSLVAETAKLPWLKAAQLGKYQGMPNLSFLAITRQCLDTIFARKLTDFDAYLDYGGIPFQVINTRQMARLFGLPVGAILWLDTGYDLPMVIHEAKLGFSVFAPVEFGAQTVFPRPADFAYRGGVIPSALAMPEIFQNADQSAPFMVHFKKGTAKAEHTAAFGFDTFKQCVNAWLAQHAVQ